MQHDEFIGHIQDRARLGSRGDAERLTRATLEERIPEGPAENLAAQLPHEVGEHLRRTAPTIGTGERFTRDEFTARISERSGMDEPAALYGARVVFEVIDEATSGSVVDTLREGLPDDLASVVAAGSGGRLDNRGGAGGRD